MEDPVITLLKCNKFEEEHGETFKSLATNKKQAINALKKQMMEQNIVCKPIGDRHFLVLDKKPVKPKLTPQTIGLILQAFFNKLGTPWNEQQIQDFLNFMDVALVQLSTVEDTVTLTTKKPVKETTGRKVQEDQIIQFAAYICEYDSLLKKKLNEWSFCEYVRPTIPICPDSIRITGITNEQVKDASRWDTIYDQFTLFLNNHLKNVHERILIAFNGTKFDVPILTHELYRYGFNPLNALRAWKITYFLDPFPLAKKYLDPTKLTLNELGLPCYKLESIFKALFQEQLQHAHDALYDSKGLMQFVLEIDVILEAILQDLSPNVIPQFAINFLTLVQKVSVVSKSSNTNKRKTNSNTCSFLTTSYKKFKKEFILDTFNEIENNVYMCKKNDDLRYLLHQPVQFRLETQKIMKTIVHMEETDDCVRLYLIE